MSIIERMIPVVREKAVRLVLPEGQDARVIKAAVKAAREQIVRPIVLGTPAEISAAEREAGESLFAAGVKVIDYTDSSLLPQLAKAFYERRKNKGMTLEKAAEIMRAERLYFGCTMVHCNLAQGLVAGSIASTGDMLRSAFQCVGTAPGIKLGSSCFLMDFKTPSPAGFSSMVFADCGVNPLPSAEQLVDIAQATALSYHQLIGGTPRVAFLSFSTKGSAEHELVSKISTAADLTRAHFAKLKLDAVVDGELQADAAIVPKVGSVKNKGGKIQGDANVLIFPDLQSGNICYKLVQRLAGADAYGPILQGLARPVNDLSRGCSTDDIFGMLVITAMQC